MTGRASHLLAVTSLLLTTANAADHVAPIPQKPAGATGPGQWPGILTGVLSFFCFCLIGSREEKQISFSKQI